MHLQEIQSRQSVNHKVWPQRLCNSPLISCAFQELYIKVEMKGSGSSDGKVAKWGLRSRAVTPSTKKDKIKWHERLVMELPKSKLTAVCAYMRTFYDPMCKGIQIAGHCTHPHSSIVHYLQHIHTQWPYSALYFQQEITTLLLDTNLRG